MKKNYFFSILFLFSSYFCFSQGEADKWYISGKTALDFSSGVPVPLANNAMPLSWEGCASISDAAGGLLFYADGTQSVLHRNHGVMPNGSGVFMANSVTQGCIFIPRPGSTNLYYLIYTGGPTASQVPGNMYYSEIDLNLNGGLGNITGVKNVPIAASTGNCSEKLCATKHCNGIDYWVLVHDYTGTTFRAYLVTAAGINTTPVVSNVGAPFVTPVNQNPDAVGQMKFSPNGTKVALMLGGTTAQVEFADFNKATGVVSNIVNLGSAGSQYPYGVEFSPDNTKIYASGAGTPAILKQWDLCAGDNNAIIASGTTIASTSGYSLQLAPDNKIYFQRFQNQLGVINNPNVTGAGCNYTNNGPVLTPTPPSTSASSLGLPSFISSFFDKPNNYSNVTLVSNNTTNCQNNGSATASICRVFGAAPYTYTWSNNTVDGPTNNLTSSISNLAPGNYSVIVTDATCMRDTLAFTIANPSPPPLVNNISICTGNSYTLPGGGIANTSGTYHDTLLSYNGCDSIITTNLTVSNNINISKNDSICSGGTYTLPGGNIVSVSGTYSDTLNSSGGCDSIITTNLTVKPADTVSVFPSICFGVNYTLPGGAVVSASGIYKDTLTNSKGCDSIVTTNLIVNPMLTGAQNPSICIGANYTLPGGNVVNAAGTYIDTIKNGNGCDSIVTTNLSVVQVITTSQNPVICTGQNFTLPDGNIVSTSGTYVDTVLSSGGCDSVITTVLSVNPPVTFSQNQNICQGQTYTLPGGTVVSIGGTYVDTVNTSVGCDSIITTNLSVLPTTSSSQNPVICSNQNFVLPDGSSVNTAGTYTTTVTGSNGCDSTITTTLTVNPIPTVSVSPDVTILVGDSVTLTASGGGTYSWSPPTGLNNTSSTSVIAFPNQTTTYCVLVTDANGCVDSSCVKVTVELPCPKAENLGVPNAFSPNADGMNDEFCLQGWNDCVESFEITIYNRWGAKVFESKKSNFCWDGKYNGNIGEAAVYVYFIKAKFLNINTVITKSGNISLIR